MFHFRRRIYSQLSCLYIVTGKVGRLVGSSPVKSDAFGPCVDDYLGESVAPPAVDLFEDERQAWAGTDLDHGPDLDIPCSYGVGAIGATPAGDDLDHGFIFDVPEAPPKFQKSEGHFAFIGDREIIIDGLKVWEAPIDEPVDATGWRMEASYVGKLDEWAPANGYDFNDFVRAHVRLQAPTTFVNDRINAA